MHATPWFAMSGNYGYSYPTYIQSIMAKMLKNFALFFATLLLIAGILTLYESGKKIITPITINGLIDRINDGSAKSLEVRGNTILVKTQNDEYFTLRKESNDTVGEVLNNYGADPAKVKVIDIVVKPEGGLSYWLAVLLPILIPFGLISIVIYFMMRQVQGGNNRALSFGASTAKEVQPHEAKNKITFADVAGAREAKQELEEIVDFLKNPKKFTALGAKIPKGILLMGSPGTGKTLLARAVAGEADVAFFHMSGSEFVEMFVGVGASRVRDLFKKAKKAAPCIIFVDEIDAVGRQRGAGLGGSHDEREQTLNQILVEMDGFDPNTGIIVMAATNRPDVLDPALLRPGRFDRRVVLDMPDVRDREEILSIHAKNKPMAQDVNLKHVAIRTPGFSGADLANLVNEAAIMSARTGKAEITMNELLPSIEKVILGPERKSHILSKEEKEVTAYHEAGHAIIAHALPHADPVRKVSIVSRGRAGGFTMKLPSEERYLKRKEDFLAELAVLLGGYTAEMVQYGKVTTGASNDLKEVSRLATKLITDYGMGDILPPRAYGQHEEMVFLGRDFQHRPDYSEKTAQLIDEEVAAIVREAQNLARTTIEQHLETFKKITAALIERETLEQEEFEQIVKGGTIGA